MRAPAVDPPARPCRACGEMVWDLRHEITGNRAPIEVKATTHGNIAVDLEAGRYRVVRGVKPEGLELHANHFMVCPEGARFRRNRIPQGARS